MSKIKEGEGFPSPAPQVLGLFRTRRSVKAQIGTDSGQKSSCGVGSKFSGNPQFWNQGKAIHNFPPHFLVSGKPPRSCGKKFMPLCMGVSTLPTERHRIHLLGLASSLHPKIVSYRSFNGSSYLCPTGIFTESPGRIASCKKTVEKTCILLDYSLTDNGDFTKSCSAFVRNGIFNRPPETVSLQNSIQL
jgi:hypothetical protein